MKKLLFLAAIVAVLAYWFVQEQGISISGLSLWTHSADSTLQKAYNNRQSDLQVQGEGVVAKILPDDLEGSRHQRFILRLSNGQTVLVAHNIDLAPRINRLRTGDTIEFLVNMSGIQKAVLFTGQTTTQVVAILMVG